MKFLQRIVEKNVFERNFFFYLESEWIYKKVT